jgi:hypothetical protein
MPRSITPVRGLADKSSQEMLTWIAPLLFVLGHEVDDHRLSRTAAKPPSANRPPQENQSSPGVVAGGIRVASTQIT